MKYSGDKQGSKFVFIAIVILFVYVAAFNFDIGEAYRATVASMGGWFR